MPSGASRSNASRAQAIGPAGPVNGASARASTTARPSRPRAPGDGDAHQSAGGVDRRRGGGLASASRRSYWRSYQPSQSPDRVARHHASFARYQATVAASPSSKPVVGRPAERGELRAVHRVAPVVTRPVLDLADERPRLAEQVEQERHDLAVRPLRLAPATLYVSPVAPWRRTWSIAAAWSETYSHSRRWRPSP